MEQMDITPKTEQEFLTMVEMHNLYHAHEPKQDGHGNNFCRVCHMQIEKNSRGWETLSRKGNTSVYASSVMLNGFGDKKGDFPVLWYVAWFIKAREFNMFDGILRHNWPAMTPGLTIDQLKSLIAQYFNPMYCLQNKIKSQQWARAAYIFARRIRQDDDMRKFASTDPEWALAYATDIDKAANDITRDGACRYMDTAIAYAAKVDKDWHPMTLIKVLEAPHTSFDYLAAYGSGNKHPKLSDAVKSRWVRDSKTALTYAKIIGPEDDTRQLVNSGSDPQDVLNYAISVDKKPINESRQAIIRIGNGEYIYKFASQVDKAGRDDTRASSLAHPQAALDYARYIDKAPRDDTRTAACKTAHTAFQYATHVDQGPNDETRLAVSKDPELSLQYANTIDRQSHWVTRLGACLSSNTAFEYAFNVDKGPHEFTRIAACGTPELALRYAIHVDGDRHELTLKVACTDAEEALTYAKAVDRRPTNITREAVQYNPLYRKQYEAYEKVYYENLVEFFGEKVEVTKKEEVNNG